jgi:hypothetical protein
MVRVCEKPGIENATIIKNKKRDFLINFEFVTEILLVKK